MLRFNLQDGSTRSFNLADEAGKAAWNDVRNDQAFQAAIRGVTVECHGVSHALPVPAGFRARPLYDAELVAHDDGTPIAVKVWYYVDKYQVTYTVYTGAKRVSRTDVRKVGNLRHRGGR